jgi:hypothetical protein
VSRAFLVVAILAAVIVGGCAPGASATPVLSSPIVGVVIAVDAASLTDVRGFTVRTTDGTSVDFKLGVLENATSFSPSHLKEHQATSEPVRVLFRVEGDQRVAYRIEDADAPVQT